LYGSFFNRFTKLIKYIPIIRGYKDYWNYTEIKLYLNAKSWNWCTYAIKKGSIFISYTNKDIIVNLKKKDIFINFKNFIGTYMKICILIIFSSQSFIIEEVAHLYGIKWYLSNIVTLSHCNGRVKYLNLNSLVNHCLQKTILSEDDLSAYKKVSFIE